MTRTRTRSLARPRRGEGRVIAGVCAAIADRFGVSRTLVRLVFVVLAITGAAELAYLALWIFLPVERR